MELGKYVVPNFRLASLLEGLKKIDNTWQGEEGTKQEIAQILKHPEDSGTLGQKISDLKAYGVLQGGRKDKYAVTDLGKMAISTDKAKSQKAIQEAIGNIELWNRLRRKHGTSIGKEFFPVILQRETGVDQAVAEKRAVFVRNAYIKDMRLIESADEPKTTPEIDEVAGEEAVGRKWDMSTQSVESNRVSLNMGQDYCIARFEIRSQHDFDVAQKTLETIRLGLDYERPLDIRLLLEAIASKLDVPIETLSNASPNGEDGEETIKKNSGNESNPPK
ncbi:MAG: hypothetical protein WB581_11055 [Halobacteriota archaeon]